MTQFGRTKVILSGFDGAPGVNLFNWCAPAHGDITQEHVDEFHDILNTSYDALTAYFFALGVRWTIDSGVSVHEVDSGEMVGVFTDGGGPYTEVSIGTGKESRATQVGLQWLTSDFRYGRRVRGRTFLGPIASDCLDTDGNVTVEYRASIPGLFEGIFDEAAPRLIVWSRPSPAHTTGAYADVVACTVAERPFMLRGRRD